MNNDWIEMCDTVLSSFILKKNNRLNIARALWIISDKESEEAKYLLYEVFTEYLTTLKTGDVFTKIKNREIGWRHAGLQDTHHRYQEFDNFLTSPPEVEEGVLECKKCGSKKTFSFSKQTRRADESATVFVRCASCNAAFRL
jgi:hypothetical protein